ncbi:MAG: polysaccharide deacetylase family protein [Clostridia bacterium]|nr:polysaccharide deacetylase family protein [Clostridia bacterium]
MRFPGGKGKAVTLSYDDGCPQDLRFADIITEYGLKCTFNLNSELLGKGGLLMREGQRIAHYKTKPEDVQRIYAGHEVAAHTLTHPRLPDQTDDEVLRQVEKDRQNLSALVGYEVQGMAYPGGGVNNDDRVAELIRAHTGVRYARTIKSTYSFELQENLYRFNPTVYHLEWERMGELCDQFIALRSETPQLFYIWGHSYEMDYDSSYWQRLEEFFKRISNREDIFYGTNSETLL